MLLSLSHFEFITQNEKWNFQFSLYFFPKKTALMLAVGVILRLHINILDWK